MKTWVERPVEEANLLNPAFCSAIITSSVMGYSEKDTSGLPYTLAFIILPIILHEPTFKLLPRNTRTSLSAWIQKNNSVRILFAERVISLKKHTKEAILFSSQYGWLILNDRSRLEIKAPNFIAQRHLRKLDGKTTVLIKRSRFLGKWLAFASSPQTVLTLWGIRL